VDIFYEILEFKLF